ncbi:MAG TPA: DUF58 domain-containing protein [Gammaproteobacteria bacterium]|nr:DUF58 domain-containing protein [Gammaproteobacteria bacterium]
MNLTRRALLLAGLVVLLGIAGQWIGPPWVGIWRYPAVLLAGLLALEALLCSRTAASAAVSLPDTAALGEPLSVRLAVAVQSGRPTPVQLAPALPAEAPERVVPATVDCAPGAPGELAIRLTPTLLGRHPWPPVPARLRGRFGLAWWPRRIATGAALNVAPGRLALASSGGGRVAGRHRGSESGDGLELHGLREYQPGDPLRRVDWKASARRGHPVVRELEQEARMSVVVALDAGRTSGVRSGPLTRLGHYVNATARLAELAAGSGDEVGLVVYADRPLAVLPPRTGVSALASIRRSLHSLRTQAADGNPLAAAVQVGRITPRRSLVVLLSDLDDADQGGQLARAVRLLGRRHLPLLGSLRDEDVEALQQRPARGGLDPYESLAALVLAESVRGNRLALARLGAQVVIAPPARLEAALLRRYGLLRRRRAV